MSYRYIEQGYVDHHLHQQDGGTAPHLRIKMIDYWLILCQLVPFAQVVLLTVKEFLRKEEQHVLENNSIRAPTPIKDNLKLDVEEKADSKEAWTISQRELSTVSSQPMFEMIGRGRLHMNPTNFFAQNYKRPSKSPMKFSISNKCSFRKESPATNGALCLRCLFCNCCKFLF